MRAQIVAVALALVLAPVGAQAADLVVWWDKRYYDQEDEAVREIIAAFEQEPERSASGPMRSAAERGAQIL
jgi:ABC-type glycerol-3-phosphate transport system substrate-binding protein